MWSRLVARTLVQLKTRRIEHSWIRVVVRSCALSHRMCAGRYLFDWLIASSRSYRWCRCLSASISCVLVCSDVDLFCQVDVEVLFRLWVCVCVWAATSRSGCVYWIVDLLHALKKLFSTRLIFRALLFTVSRITLHLRLRLGYVFDLSIFRHLNEEQLRPLLQGKIDCFLTVYTTTKRWNPVSCKILSFDCSGWFCSTGIADRFFTGRCVLVVVQVRPVGK